MKTKEIELAVIGAGPAGMAAALSASESGLRDIYVFERMDEPGGILPQCIHNGFGLRYFEEELTGPEYAGRFIESLKKSEGITLKTGTMVTDLTSDLELITVSRKEGLLRYRANAVVLAMGCRERPRGAINIAGTRPSGIFTAGSIQRLMNIEGYLRGKSAVILGSGDIGLIIARRLTLEGIKVNTVIELMPYSSGLTRNIVQCLEDFDIPLLLSHTVLEVKGEGRLESVKVAPVDHSKGRPEPLPERAFTIACDTLVLSVGLIPENELSAMAGVLLDPNTGGPLVSSDCQTTIPGLFACGNVLHVHDLVDDVTAESIAAGRGAARYILEGAGSNPAAAAAEILEVRHTGNIRSVVPQRIISGRDVTLYIRPRHPGRNARLLAGGTERLVRHVTPGETIRIKLTPENIDPLTFPEGTAAGTIPVVLAESN